MVVQSYLWMFYIDWVRGSVWAASPCRVTKAHATCGGINIWVGKVAVTSLPSMVFSLTFLQGQFVAELWQAELLQPCCSSSRNVTHPCRDILSLAKGTVLSPCPRTSEAAWFKSWQSHFSNRQQMIRVENKHISFRGLIIPQDIGLHFKTAWCLLFLVPKRHFYRGVEHKEVLPSD